MEEGFLELGAKLVVEHYLKVAPENRFIIITDRLCSPFAASIAKMAGTITADVHFFEMEKNSNGSRIYFPSEFMKLYEESPRKVASVYMHHQRNNKFSKRYELLNMEDPLSIAASRYGIKHLSLPGLTDSLIRHGICSPDNGLTSFNDKLESKLRGAKEIRIITRLGTDLSLQLSPGERHWVKEDERSIVYGDWQNLPVGEVYTVPKGANGRLVLGGLIGGHEKYRFFGKDPVLFEIEDGSICSISSNGPSGMIEGIKSELLSTETSRRVAEIGFGTNLGIKKLACNLLLAEKYPGLHIAFGDPVIFIGKEHEAPNHTDMVLLNPTVYVDGSTIMEEGKYLIQ